MTEIESIYSLSNLSHYKPQNQAFCLCLSPSLLPLPLQNKAFCLCLSCTHCFSTACSHGSPFYFHRGSPPPTDPHAGIRKESQPILNSLSTHTSSTAPKSSTSPILQESAVIFPHRFYIPISQQQEKINFTPLGIEPGLQRLGVEVTTIVLPSTAISQILQFINSHYHSLGLQLYLFSRLTGHLTNNQAANYESWMVRCSPCTPGFSHEQSA